MLQDLLWRLNLELFSLFVKQLYSAASRGKLLPKPILFLCGQFDMMINKHTMIFYSGSVTSNEMGLNNWPVKYHLDGSTMFLGV